MPKSIFCPTCHKDFQDDTPDLVAEALKPLTEAVKGLPAQFPKPAELPSRLSEVLESVAKSGQHMDLIAKNWEAQKAAEAEAQSHSQVPTPEDIEHFRTCPNCAPAWTKIYDGIAAAARTGYVPAEEATKGYVKSEDAKAAITETARQLIAAKREA